MGKVKAARDQKRATRMKVEGRKSYAEIDARDHGSQMIAPARKLRRKAPKGDRSSLRAISDEMAGCGCRLSFFAAHRSHVRSTISARKLLLW